MSEQPNILPPSAQQAWDLWCDTRSRNVALSVSDDVVEALSEEFLNEVERVTKKLFEIVEVVSVLADDNPLLVGKIDKIAEGFSVDGVPARITRSERTIRKSAVSVSQQTLDILSEVLTTN